MKARMEQKDAPEQQTVRISGKGPYHGHPIRLTIGLIVKNEEKTLDRCLSSLKPLMKAVESELIVTDTGSTDRTVEIAEKYTDHIIHFQWCDDFSAARNTGLFAARGEWFLFLDGDEWFENTDDLIGFFTSGECDRYGSASFVVRNYSDFKGRNYSDFHALRVSRIYEGIRFRNTVHEDLVRLAPTKFLSDYVHHYGYAYHNKQEKQEKHRRNIGLLEKELENDPYNLKAYCQISGQYFNTGETDLVKKYCELGLQAEKERPDRIGRISLLHNLAKARFQSKEYAKVLELVEELFRTDSKTEIIWLDFLYYAQSASFRLEEYERSEAYGREFVRVYDLYRNDRLDQTILMFMVPFFLKKEDRERVLCLLCETCLNLKHFRQVEEICDQLNLSNPGSVEQGARLICRSCSETGDWEKLSAFYSRALLAGGQPSWRKLIGLLETFLPSGPDQRQAAARAIADLSEDDDAYVRLCRLRKAKAEGNQEVAKRELDWFFRWGGEWEPELSDAVFYGLEEKINLMPLILQIDMAELSLYLRNMQRQHGNYKIVIQDYLDSYSYENLKGLYWSVCLRKSVLLMEWETGKENDEINFFEKYARQTAKYVNALYRPELLSPDRVSVLPREHRFGYFMGLALSARDQADYPAYLFNLRLALKSYPVMKKPVSLLLERFEREDRLHREKAEEFNKLAGQAKEQIRGLIAQGKLKEAGRYTLQLAKLLPDDPDVVQFRTLTHTEPGMNELAARLPQ